jgi:hypothetical protein
VVQVPRSANRPATSAKPQSAFAAIIDRVLATRANETPASGQSGLLAALDTDERKAKRCGGPLQHRNRRGQPRQLTEAFGNRYN